MAKFRFACHLIQFAGEEKRDPQDFERAARSLDEVLAFCTAMVPASPSWARATSAWMSKLCCKH